jgi:hypothetical protein
LIPLCHSDRFAFPHQIVGWYENDLHQRSHYG